MSCIRHRTRTLFNLFEIFTCDNCNEVYDYDYILIGRQVINIYKRNSKCSNDIYSFKYLKLLLKEFIYNKDDVNFVICEDEYINVFDYIPSFLDEFRNVNILLL